MKTYDTNIPGWMNEKELIILSTLANLVPNNGRILEVGCFLGSSTSALYMGKHLSVDIDVVDNFELLTPQFLNERPFTDFKFSLGNQEIFNVAKEIALRDGGQSAFKFCVGEAMYGNINLYPISSKEFIKDKTYDIAFIDASHKLLDVLHDINKYDSDGTLLLGDDYGPLYNGIPLALNQTRKNRTLVVFENTKLWALIPKHGYWREIFKNTNLLFLD